MISTFKTFNSNSNNIFENEENTGLYIGIKYTQETNEIIKRVQNNLLRKSKPHDDIHTTLIYSKLKDSYNERDKIKLMPKFNLKNVIMKTKKFGDYLVLVIEHEWFKDRHAYFMNNFKFSYDYPEYHPHITLTYKDEDYIPEGLSFCFDLQIDHEYTQRVDEDYVN